MDADKALYQEAGWLSKTLKDQIEAIARLRGYLPKMERKYQCPRCWIVSGLRRDLRAVPSDSDDHDILRCEVCGGDFVVPL